MIEDLYKSDNSKCRHGDGCWGHCNECKNNPGETRFMVNIKNGELYEYDENQVSAKRYMVECDKDGVVLSAETCGHISDPREFRGGLRPEEARPGMNLTSGVDFGEVAEDIDKRLLQLNRHKLKAKALLEAPSRFTRNPEAKKEWGTHLNLLEDKNDRKKEIDTGRNKRTRKTGGRTV